MKLSRFEIVKSTAGHDQGNIYLVADIIDEDYVLLIDGKNKKISNPKKKKIKHIISLNIVETQLESIFEDKSKINDGEIRKILKKYQKNC
jgi:ribosomal protein L14E/L6E/L27E